MTRRPSTPRYVTPDQKRLRLWGVATIERGIYAFGTLRSDALMNSGLATKVRRCKVGREMYQYTGESGRQVVIGRVAELLCAGFKYASNDN